MNFEVPQFEAKKPDLESLDDVWYERLKNLAAFMDFEYLSGNKEVRELEKQKFLSNKVKNPSLDYPEIEKMNFAQKESGLLDLKKDILQNERNETLKQVYRWKINEKLAELRMLTATKNGNDHRVSHYSRFIYGSPEKEIYNYTLSQIKKIVDEKILSSDFEIKAAVVKIKETLLQNLSSETSISAEDFKSKSTILAGEETMYGAEEIKTAFEAALEKYCLFGWKIVIEKEKTGGISTSQEKKRSFHSRRKKTKKTRTLFNH